METIASREGSRKGVARMGSVVIFSRSIPYSGSESQASASQASQRYTLPRLSMTLDPGRSDQEKAALAEAIAQDTIDLIGAGNDTLCVAIEEISPKEWIAMAYETEIIHKPSKPSPKPGYAVRSAGHRISRLKGDGIMMHGAIPYRPKDLRLVDRIVSCGQSSSCRVYDLHARCLLQQKRKHFHALQ
jgi:4-oxalocrotonate tautomerase